MTRNHRHPDWHQPLSEAPLVESELQHLLSTVPDIEVRTTLAAIFRRAISLQRGSHVNAYLGAPPKGPRDVSIMLRHLFLCAAYKGRDLWLMIENLPGIQQIDTWRDYELHPSAATNNELAWIYCSLGELAVLKRVLVDDEVWRSYARMLHRITTYNRSDRPDTLRRLSVLA